MKKKEIIETVVESTGLPMKDVEKVVNETIYAIADGISNKEDVMLRDLGTFKIVHRKTRIGRDFRTHKTITIPAQNIVVFTPCSQLREKVK